MGVRPDQIDSFCAFTKGLLPKIKEGRLQNSTTLVEIIYFIEHADSRSLGLDYLWRKF